ncbi:MAG: serine/threonine-protein phosphatase [Gemmatimonadota bacterium]|nr:MAG: serine/threonine-protein phosphatase [Gemmatimonadota bacterium]
MASDPHRPAHKDIDVYGLTHRGLVRKSNEDHFFTGMLSSGVEVDYTSITSNADQVLDLERVASLAMVADGVGSTGGGEEAARIAVQTIRRHVSKGFPDAYAVEATDPEAFSRLLSDAALACHETLLERAEADPEHTRYATTLTLFLGLWPHGYLLQVGDSRCYMYRDDKLTQISRDQTMAQDLIDKGVLTQTKAHQTKWAHVLSSSIGGQQAVPVVTKIVRKWGTIMLFCSDGLTKHVSDERIGEHLSNLKSSRQTCEALLQDVLDDGGTDNVTIIVGRTVKPED